GNNGHGFPLLWVLMKAQTSSWHFDAEPRLPPQPRDGEVPYIRKGPSMTGLFIFRHRFFTHFPPHSTPR
ncbi:hypothetical protein, partial [Paraburkholderia sp. EG304]|uniref:hypothetical protein n=1 Tax=Paraburkholderia sp. EG304 TaxID=3237015 RepID=UPI003978154D